MTGNSAVPTATVEDAARRALRLMPRFNRWAQSRAVQGDSGCDLSLRQLSALYLIREESTTLGDLARRLMVTPAVITGLIDRLEKRGYVRRVNEPGDRRRIHLALTEEGRRASLAVEQVLVDEMSARIANYTPQELRDMERGLDLLSRMVIDLEPRRTGSRA